MNKLWKYGAITGIMFTMLVLDVSSALSAPKPKYSRCKNSQEYCLRRGDRGRLVDDLIGGLICVGIDNVNSEKKDDPDYAVFTEKVENAVKEFQKTANIKPDGIARPATIKAIQYGC
ncbi:peptidoglycan-binding protein [Anabaena sphaerica FACHB-251]|uniref:Peptidoglycan-binding protein n=1 Tax=Anabaena sphaerica FACHB-251 TaxID=2692883 RepID=A0A926WIB4_9NOST|nr:peptidoglycan-binding domain-containing protein [Anabaena sphaerica]MBD2295104.1 peptidoglycan-binding protein [Anabaena sphaerica FACHB-251]